MTKRLHNHKLLLDENMSQRRAFPNLNKNFDVKHLRDDLNRGGVEDAAVYRIAVNQKRIIVTKNWTDFIKLAATKKDVGVIGVPSEWLDEYADKKLLSLLRKNSPASLKGKVTTLGALENLRQKYSIKRKRIRILRKS